MPRVADVLLVYYATIGSPSCFSVTKVRFIMLGFVEVVQVKANLCYIVIVFLFSKRKLGLILISLLTIS
jgi:hypothetical protein